MGGYVMAWVNGWMWALAVTAWMAGRPSFPLWLAAMLTSFSAALLIWGPR